MIYIQGRATISMADFASKLKELKIQGAVNIALQSLIYLKKYAKKHGFGSKFDAECRRLMAARPTAVPLYNVIGVSRKKKSIEEMERMIKDIKKHQNILGKKGRTIFRKKSVIMTHCHSHEAVALMKINKSRIKEVYVTETRPRNQGLLTANDLRKAGIRVNFITDSSADFYIKKTDMVIVGADSLRKEGFINKVGTLELAVLSKEFGKRFYVVSSTLKLDRRPKIKIEMRKPSEVCRIRSDRKSVV